MPIHPFLKVIFQPKLGWIKTQRHKKKECIYLPIMYFSQQDLSSRAEYVIHSKNLGILYSTENVMTERTKCRALIINRYRKKGSHNEKYLSIVSDTVVQLKKVENPRYIYVFCINTFDVLLVHAWSNRASFEPRE